MWLTQTGIEAVPFPCTVGMLPDPEAARACLTPRVRVIVLVTPNNPTGAEYPPELVARFAALARAGGFALILDETYRDFASRPGPPHDLFADPDWHDTLVHLYSFSKEYRLTGHRVGAIVASPVCSPRPRSSSTPPRSAPRASARRPPCGASATSTTGSPASAPRSSVAATR